MSVPERDLRSDHMDDQRQRAIDLLTGIHSSRKTYYPALREKIKELEESNELLERAREEAETLSLELQKAVTRTSAVLGATRHISRYLGLRELVRETLGLLTGSMGYPWAAIHVFREPAGEKELIVESAAAPDLAEAGSPPSLDALAAHWGFKEARETGRSLTTEETSAGELQLFFLPLPAERRIRGMLTVGSPRILPEDVDVCRGVAQSLALAMENAILYRRVSIQARRLDQTLVTIDTLSKALTRTTEGLDAFTAELVQRVAHVTVAQHVVVLPTPKEIGDELRAAAADNPEPFWLDDGLLELVRPAGGRYLRALCIPMRRARHLEGLILAFFNLARDLAPRETEMLTILGNQAAVSLENTRLYEEGERLRKKAESLYEVALEQKQEAERSYEELQRALHRISAIEKQQIVQAERSRIAQELHDTVAQVLYSLGLNLAWCQEQAPAGSALRERLGALRELAAGCVQEMRQSIFELSPAISEYGLRAALEKLAQDYPKLTSIDLELELPERLPDLGRPEQNELYRIVQESLFNTYKHARASQAVVRLRVEEDSLHLLVQDDGVGMNMPDDLAEGTKLEATFGLASMRRRAEALGGSFRVESSPGAGTMISLEVPLLGLVLNAEEAGADGPQARGAN